MFKDAGVSMEFFLWFQNGTLNNGDLSSQFAISFRVALNG